MGPVDTRQGVCVACSVLPPNPNNPATPLWCLPRRCDNRSHVFPASPSLSTYTERKCTTGTQHLARMQGEPGAISCTGTVVEDRGPEATQTVICTWSRTVSRKETRSEEAMKKGRRTSWQRRAPLVNARAKFSHHTPPRIATTTERR